MDNELPVLVGVAAFSHRGGDAPELTDLLTEATRRAEADAGVALLDHVGWVGVPKGAWGHPDPGRVVAPKAHTVLAEVGVLQQEVIDRACRAVQHGDAEVALVVGGESNQRSATMAAGAVVEARAAASGEPDEHLVSTDGYVNAGEINARFYDPPVVYAAIESAFAAAQGWSADEHRARLGELWAGFSAVAATNPEAWTRDRYTAADILDPSDDNRMVSEPYTKRCCSNMRVDQAAALLLTTVGTARRLGIDEARWVFPHGAANANHAVPVSQRAEVHRSPNARAAGERALDLAGIGVDDLDHLDLYSCFPAAVQVAAHELGIPLAGRPAPTVTGGMAFAGGPLNSYVLHSTTAMAVVLRGDPGSTGLVTSVSGFITKYGAGIWSTRPPAGGSWRSDDVTAEAAALAGPTKRIADTPPDGPLQTVTSTVEHQRDGSTRTITIADAPDGTRAVVTT